MSMTLADLLDLHAEVGADLPHEDPAPTPPPVTLPPAPEPDPEPPAAAQLVPVTGGGQMSRRQQAFTAVGHAFRQAHRNWDAAKKAKGGPIAWFENWHPESMAELFAYRDSRAWVPTGHDGGTADQVGTFYYSYVAPWLARGLLFGLWVVQRFFRFCVALGLTALVVGTTVYLLH